ncbi:MAG: prenyltransferase [Desulfovibrionaceae bacterium]|nr:prenyltransferase [Desulfovibrionaceae bacterium]
MTFVEIMARTLADRPFDAPERSARTLLKAWWRVCRPPFFITAAIPVLVGLAFVMRMGVPLDSSLWLRLVALLVGCGLGLTIANVANELFDYVLGVDDQEDSIGGTGVIQSGLISCRELFIATIALVIATLAIGIGLVCTLPPDMRPVLIVLTLFAVGSAVFYVAPPIRYGCRGWGEVMVGINMGFIIVGASTAILAQSFDLRALGAALPVVGMVAGILYYQSLPEIETDARAGKKTLANILGKDHALFVFRLWWPAVWISMGNLWLCGLAGWPVIFCLVSAPLWWKAQRLVAACGDGDWLPLDKHGYLVRLCYLISGAALIWGVAWR